MLGEAVNNALLAQHYMTRQAFATGSASKMKIIIRHFVFVCKYDGCTHVCYDV
jgi:hypothetical protein